jgi:hypothetical protein
LEKTKEEEKKEGSGWERERKVQARREESNGNLTGAGRYLISFA